MSRGIWALIEHVHLARKRRKWRRDQASLDEAAAWSEGGEATIVDVLDTRDERRRLFEEMLRELDASRATTLRRLAAAETDQRLVRHVIASAESSMHERAVGCKCMPEVRTEPMAYGQVGWVVTHDRLL